MRLVVLLALSLAACDDGPFADPDHPTRDECAAIEQRWLDVVDTIDRHCEIDDDCVVIGGGYCDGGMTSLGSCNGTPVGRAGWEGARGRLDDARDGWGQCTCDLIGCCVDAQPGTPRCVSGVCLVEENVCNPPQP